jgi:hypothetical protein
VYFFSSGAAVLSNAPENAGKFSELSIQGKEKPVIEILKKEFPFIEAISLQMNAGSAMLYATVNYLPAKIPIGMLSGGINELVSLLLAMVVKKQGVMLIDEIEKFLSY